MSTAASIAIRRTLGQSVAQTRAQRRWARVHDVRFVTTHRDQERILDRYREKLEQKAKQEGLDSVSSLKEAYKDKIQEYKRAASTLPPGAKLPSSVTTPASAPTSSTPSSSSQATKHSPFQQPPPPPPTAQPIHAKGPDHNSMGIKPLSSYLDLEKVAALSNKEVEYIWRLRHANDPRSLCAVIPLETYNRIYRTARTHPQFVLPLPRPTADDGSGDVKQSPHGFEGGERTAADIHFLQWGFHPPAGAPRSPALNTANTHTSTVIFTHLAAFKLHGSYAQPHTTVTHHLDLADSHGLVLLNGSVVDGRGVSVEEGRWLLMCLQRFYDAEGHGGGIGRDKRQGLLEKFSKGDQGFNLEELVDEAERIS
ncbi:hypothetical protein A1O1_01374 [Capronia coronata CBS 617.96]|uniref:ATP synthase mitochondrial F1 complex assembly factor 1 n=1 Tax=Capronia coronata CBS 617.96 TaxID=1182541 RepID=W9YUQ0_9EURO|nr:uncharacterized protein A1O1_01374 [Capronia coronata CBS 617.96]EXJ96248.1 hypothetical protein A1O1_01374 [Capronia coronata CBS 617.96]